MGAPWYECRKCGFSAQDSCVVKPDGEYADMFEDRKCPECGSDDIFPFDFYTGEPYP